MSDGEYLGEDDERYYYELEPDHNWVSGIAVTVMVIALLAWGGWREYAKLSPPAVTQRPTSFTGITCSLHTASDGSEFATCP